MGTGKSTVGKIVAQKKRMSFIDSDEAIEQATGKTVSQIFATEGEKGFRELEKVFISNGHPKENSLISCGGGLCMIDGILEELKSKGVVVCLWAETPTIYNRIKNDTHRPLLLVDDPISEIQSIINQRKNTYFRADLVIMTDHLSPQDVACQIIEFRENADPSKLSN